MPTETTPLESIDSLLMRLIARIIVRINIKAI